MGRISATAAGLVALAVLASMLARPCRAFCLPPPGWHTKSLLERLELRQADAAVLASVLAVHRDPEASQRQPYTADLEVKCAFERRPGAPLPPLPAVLKDVLGFGGVWDCAESKVEEGKEYIVLLDLSYDGQQARVAEVNLQEGAEQALPARLRKLEERFQCLKD